MEEKLAAEEGSELGFDEKNGEPEFFFFIFLFRGERGGGRKR